ncbi:inositol monophosphatase [Nakamurella sp. YIM 132087]|uniref:Inositol monophosphatase n=1 Tax=Nakamurella alba TaxID=2665158 RepID=A0A7K1FK10_9ACTN|nr:inositol monophosphatase family protein [Nakamurella alba]MTD14475.1 inositol monophosphatase [Nakamurella alba]
MALPLAGRIGPGTVSAALEVAGRLASDATEVITATAGRQAAPDAKANPFDWVTETDRTLERHTRRVLEAAFPGVPVLGEEYGGAEHGLPGEPGGPELLWIVDPVDGTANYVAGLRWCCYSLGLVDAQGPLVGVIADPYRGVVFSGARDRGLFADGRPMAPPAAPADGTLAGSLIFTEPGRPGTRPELAALTHGARAHHAGVRHLGSSALALAQVPLGHATAAVLPQSGYHSWDVAGALALAVAAGLAVTDLDGRPSALPLDGVVVAVPAVLDEVLALING